jgi:hypothetical protein
MIARLEDCQIFAAGEQNDAAQLDPGKAAQQRRLND